MRLAGHSIANGTGLYQAKARNAGFLSAQTFHELTLSDQKARGGERGIVRLSCRHAQRLADMQALAMNASVCLAGARKHGPRAARHRVGGQVGPHMETENPVDVVALKDARLADHLGAARGLLGRLEHEEHVARQLARMLTQCAIHVRCHGERHRHMGIVPAGVHPSRILTRKRGARGLLDRKGVHVCTDGRGAARAGTGIEVGTHAAAARTDDLARKRVQGILDIRDGLSQIKIELGDAVERTAMALKLSKLVCSGCAHRGAFRVVHSARHYRAGAPRLVIV